MEEILSHKSSSQATSQLLTEAQSLINSGYSIFPVRGKEPVIPYAWFFCERMDYKRFEYLTHTRNATGIALLGGSISQNITVIDAETGAWFQEVRNGILETYGRDTWTQHSGKESGAAGHFVLQTPYPVSTKKQVVGGGGTELEICATKHFTLMAPSLHPSGRQYFNVVPPAQVIYADKLLPFLPRPLEPAPYHQRYPRHAHHLYHGYPDYLSKTLARLTDPTPSGLAQSFIASMQAAGFSCAHIGSALRSSFLPEDKHSYSRRYKEDKEAAKAWLQLSYDRAVEENAAKQEGFQQFFADWQEASQRVLHRKGARGSLDYKVLLALTTLAHKTGKITFYASTRDVAELASTDYRTASHSMNRLQEQGIISIYRESPRATTEVTLILPRCQVFPTHEVRSQRQDKSVHVWGVLGTFSESDDYLSLWEYRGLGASARVVFESVASPLLTYADIAAATGKGIRTVKRLLPKLIEKGLIDKTANGYQQRPAHLLDFTKLADKFNSAQERRQKRAAKHVADRAARKEAMLEWKSSRQGDV